MERCLAITVAQKERPLEARSRRIRASKYLNRSILTSTSLFERHETFFFFPCPKRQKCSASRSTRPRSLRPTPAASGEDCPIEIKSEKNGTEIQQKIYSKLSPPNKQKTPPQAAAPSSLFFFLSLFPLLPRRRRREGRGRPFILFEFLQPRALRLRRCRRRGPPRRRRGDAGSEKRKRRSRRRRKEKQRGF